MTIRLEELQTEWNAGSRRLQELEREQAQLREVMLRISGAMQVLRELLDKEGLAADECSEPVSVRESNGHLSAPPKEAVAANR